MNRSQISRTVSVAIAIALFTGAVAGAEKIVWKGVPIAVLKVDERPAKIWDVFVSKEHKGLILVQLGSRFLMLDTEEKQVRELPADSLKRTGRDLHGELPAAEAESKAKLLATADWSEKSAGNLRIWKVRLTEEGRLLEVQLPQQGDLRKFY